MLDKSGSMKTNYGLVRAGAEAFVRRLMAGDKARVGTFSDKIEIQPEGFTADQEGLVRILRSGEPPVGPTPLWNASNEAITALSGQQGRRVVLAFTDGADNPGNLKTNNLSLMDVMERAQREDVMFYAIGLESRTPPTMGGGMRSGGFGCGRLRRRQPARHPASGRRACRRSRERPAADISSSPVQTTSRPPSPA